MSFTIFAQDNEFAAATGSNVNNGPGTSTFDYPPNSTWNLTITTKSGDADPRLFELGDVYEVSFTGNGGTTITDAVVVRSDMAPGGGGAIVFEGLDSGGNLTQVIWTPGFDLEGWYWTNYGPSNPPGFYTTDQNAAYSHSFMCFDAATRIATPRGMRRAGDLAPGDEVITVDHGARPLVWVARRCVPGRGAMTPVLIRAGVLGNSAPLRLSPQHAVLSWNPLLPLYFDLHEALVPIRALIDGRDIRYAPCHSIEYVHLMLDRHQLLLAEGAVCESLRVVPDWCAPPDLPAQDAMLAVRPILTFHEAVAMSARARPPDPVPAPVPML